MRRFPVATPAKARATAQHSERIEMDAPVASSLTARVRRNLEWRKAQGNPRSESQGTESSFD